MQTALLPLVLAKLDTAMKKSSKAKRVLDRSRASRAGQQTARSPLSQLADIAAPPILRRSHRAASSQQTSITDLGAARKSRKGKEREETRFPAATSEYSQQMRQHHASRMPSHPTTLPGSLTPPSTRQGVALTSEAAWWMDVASPTYDDLRNIGKVSYCTQ